MLAKAISAAGNKYTFDLPNNWPISGKLAESASPALYSTLLNEFYLPPKIHTNYLQFHFVRHWTGNYFRHNLKPDHLIQYGDTLYICVLPFGTVVERFFSAPQVKVSFRIPKSDLGIPPLCLVRYAHRNTEMEM